MEGLRGNAVTGTPGCGARLGVRVSPPGDTGNLGDVIRALGDGSAARRLYEESLAVWQEPGDERGTAQCFEGFAALALDELAPVRAVRLLAAAVGLRDVVGDPPSPNRQEQLDRLLEAAPSALGHHEYAAAWARGRAMTTEQAVADTRSACCT